MNIDSLLGGLAVALAAVSYVPYIRDIFHGRTRPHAFSWLIWATIASIGFAAQLTHGAGPGAWLTGFTAGICLLIAILAVWKGDRSYSTFDWGCLLAAAAAIIPWAVTGNALTSVILAVIIDVFAFAPTFVKTYHRPFTETAATYILATISIFLSIAAIADLTLINVLYPLCLGIIDLVFLLMMFVRRKQLTAATGDESLGVQQP